MFRREALAGLDGSQLADISFADPTHGWIAGWDSSGAGFLASTADTGRTWSLRYPSSALSPRLAISFATPRLGFGLGLIADPRVVLRTEDGGRTWRPIGRLPADPSGDEADGEPILSFVSRDDGYVARKGGGLFQTTDGGATWQVTKGGPPGGVFFVNPRVGCTGSFYGAAATIDGGLTWSNLGTKHGLVPCALGLVDPAWIERASPFGPPAMALPIISAAGTDDAWAIGMLDATTPGLERTTDGGRTWTALRWPHPPPDAIISFIGASFTDPTHGWVLTLAAHLYATSDGGSTWQQFH